jgi:hypothetical protein
MHQRLRIDSALSVLAVAVAAAASMANASARPDVRITTLACNNATCAPDVCIYMMGYNCQLSNHVGGACISTRCGGSGGQDE